MASRSGPMAHSMRVGGKTTRPMGKGDSSMLMETFMMATGRMIRLMDLAYTAISTVLDIRETGKRTSSTVRVLRPGPIMLVTKVTMWRERNMVRVNLHGPMEVPTKASSMRITLRAKV